MPHILMSEGAPGAEDDLTASEDAIRDAVLKAGLSRGPGVSILRDRQHGSRMRLAVTAFADSRHQVMARRSRSTRCLHRPFRDGLRTRPTFPGFWAQLPRYIRSLLDDCIDAATRYANSIAKTENDQALAVIASSGTTKVVELSERQRRDWQKALQPIYQQIADPTSLTLVATAHRRS